MKLLVALCIFAVVYADVTKDDDSTLDIRIKDGGASSAQLVGFDHDGKDLDKALKELAEGTFCLID